MNTVRLAATVVLLRNTESGVEIFLVQRNRAMGFLPNAWVFPGGRVDPTDATIPITFSDRWIRPMETSLSALIVAAIRETYEESGLWLGEVAPDPSVREKLCAGEVTFSELVAAHTIDPSRLAPWSRWITPVVEPKRFDTQFFVARAPDGAAIHDQSETVASQWLTPKTALAMTERGELPMAPPTWWTLTELSSFERLEDIIEAGWIRPHRPIEPLLIQDQDGFGLILPGHPEHTEPEIEGLPKLIRYYQGRWWN